MNWYTDEEMRRVLCSYCFQSEETHFDSIFLYGYPAIYDVKTEDGRWVYDYVRQKRTKEIVDELLRLEYIEIAKESESGYRWNWYRVTPKGKEFRGIFVVSDEIPKHRNPRQN